MIHSVRNSSNQNPRFAEGKGLEPIAIIGLGCRFPGGANDWRRYWHLLDSATDAITETPADRWNLQKFYVADRTKISKTQSKWGGYIDGIEMFDPQLFGISPREAASMDPQQRLLLEVAFRAMEDAGQPLELIAGQPVSVFVGISSFDYAVASLSFQDRGVIDAYSNTGGSSSIAANRISYCFDLRGPSVAVDTACSSSLVAVHLACESIWRGEAQMALAGGVNALILPDFYVAFSQLGVLSPDGRCRSFDARANGYVRSEGAGMVMLKPLSAALRDHDPVYAVIRATGLNQDGRTPGMTVPSQQAQESLIRSTCEKANIRPSDIQYVEAHGTGTPVGDPIEASAIGSVVGNGRAVDSPCFIGSVKTNIGHLEAGAGMASLLKVALALHHRRIPAHLHFQTANPAIDFKKLNLRVPTESVAWESKQSRLAGINGFGYGGANAHIILEQAPETAHAATQADDQVSPLAVKRQANGAGRNGSAEVSLPEVSPFDAPVLLPLSARNQTALVETARVYAETFAQTQRGHLAEVASYLAHRRSHHDCRAALVASNWSDMLAELRALADRSPEEVVPDFDASKLARGVAFLCSGQGPQWWAMGRGLLKFSPAFRTVIKRCDAEFAKYGDWSLVTELTRRESASRMQKTAIAQPSIFALQVALAAVWKSWGIKPKAIVGHSVGEIASAYLSGALGWEDACCVAFHRGRTMDLASSQGAMVAVGLSAAEIPRWLQGIDREVSVAAINGPSSITVSGAATAIDILATRLEDAGVFCRRLAVEYAFHSPQMEPVRDELLRSLAHIQPQRTHTALISTVTGRLIDGEALDADYWWQNVRQSVRFADAMACLADMGFGLAIEIGPHPVLAYSVNECFQAAGKAVVTVPSLNRQQDDLLCISKSLGNLYALGCDIRWSGFYNLPSRRIDLPSYPFQSQRLWSETLESQVSRLAEQTRPLLGDAMIAPAPQWQQRIDVKLQNYLVDHKVRGTIVYPAAAILETAFAAVSLQQPQAETIHLQRVRLHNPCVVSQDRPQWIQTDWDATRQQLSLAFRQCDEQQWSALATIDVSSQPAHQRVETAANQNAELAEVRQRCTESFDAERLYEHCTRIGLNYGASFRGVQAGLRNSGEAILDVVLPASVEDDDGQFALYTIHPALLDSCFHGMIAADPDFDHTVDGLYLPYEIRQVLFHRSANGPVPERVTVVARCVHKSKKSMLCDLDIYDPCGKLHISLRGFESRRVSGGAVTESTEELIYSYSWVERSLTTAEQDEPLRPAGWLLFMDERGVGQQLSARLQKRGERVVEVYREAARRTSPQTTGSYRIAVESLDSYRSALTSAAAELDNLVTGVVYLWGLDAPAADQLDVASLNASTQLTTLAPVYLVQAWEQLSLAESSQLTVVTAGAQSADGVPEKTEVAQAPLIGLARVIVSEFAGLRCRQIDLPREIVTQDVDCLFRELLSADEEDEVMWRGGQRYAHRFGPQAGKPASADAAATLACRLRVGNASGIEELHYETQPPLTLCDGQVEIEVVATGLNFSDVMKALDLYPGLPDGPVDLGAECSGRISRVPAHSRWRVGDEVLAIAPGSFASHVVVDETLVSRKPRNLTHEQAAALPIAFLTAEYALVECARLREGDSVLIHSASGGVGLAAMQLARLAGVQILATAGSEAKRQFVRELGASCVMDSRSLAFGNETLAATQGRGVDAVLNSLPGEAIATGLSVLKTGGRFLEIGKRDIYNDAALGMFPFRNNLSLFAIDLDQLFREQPERMGRMLKRLVERFESGGLQPLPVMSFSADDTKAAYRYMQQGKHIGKVVVNYSQRPSDIQNAKLLKPREPHTLATCHVEAGQAHRDSASRQIAKFQDWSFDPAACYWIVGGMGGFGLEIVRWMAMRGARSLVLSGRSATPRPAAQRAIAELSQAGVQVSVLPADITSPTEVRRVLQTIQATLPPLRGIVHTAMVLEDKLLIDLDRETLQRVLRPKVLGGWNLHQETLELELDCFLLFSSLSSVFGHAGQGNYSAANALLDSLAYYRRAQGLPATVVNWGHLGEVGYLAEREQLGQRLERQGVLSFSVRQATDCLEYALQNKALQLSVLRIDWSVWRGLGITNRVSPRFAHLLRNSSAAELAIASEQASASHLRSLALPALRLSLERLLRVKLGSLLGIVPDKIPADRALLEMGLDSLMAVELRNWIESQLEVNFPISALMRSEGLTQVIGVLVESLKDDRTSPPTQAEPSSPALQRSQDLRQTQVTELQAEELLEQLPNLDSAEVTQLLSQMLGEQ